MRLYLVQHGDAVDADEDPDRPLSETGNTDVARLAAQLGGAGVRVERILHSGRTRALQTAAKLAHSVLAQGEMDTSGLLAPSSDPEPLVQLIFSWACDSMIVGHQPLLGQLASRLLSSSEGRALIAFTPGTVLCLEGNPDSGWQVAWMLSPELLRPAK